jgi:nucleotide-binding universal stress UspA family protein
MRTPDKAPVVVGVNGSAAGLAAARLAAREAVARGLRLRVVHAFTWPGLHPHDDEQDYASARHDAGRIVGEAVGTAKRSTPGVRVTGQLIDGPPVRVLLQQSRTADLIILGDDDLATLQRLPIDSVLMQTVSRARCPVVVARGLRPPVGPLLAAVDGSPASLHALRHAAVEARRRSVAIEVAHVVRESGPAAQAAGRRLLEAAVAAVPELPAPRIRLLIGDPAIALIRASRHARMVIVGPRGADGSALLGAVAEELLRRCACPTVFVHGTTALDRWSPGTVPSAGSLAG